MRQQPHILLVAYPAQGHINPALQFPKRLLRLGVNVTFVTTVAARRRMTKSLNLNGFSFATFSDGYDDGFNPNHDVQYYLSEMKRNGSQTLTDLITTSSNEGCTVTCLVYSLFFPWAAKAARDLHIPSTLLWIQPSTVFDIYYYYFNGYKDIIAAKNNKPSCLIELPGLPPLTTPDIPSFLLPSAYHSSIFIPTFEEHLKMLNEERNPKILVNTFDALELEALRAIEKYNFIGIGPLIPSAFLDGKDPLDTSFGGDLFESSNDYIEWLNSKHKSSVVYVSFGSISVLSKQQMEEIARGLLDSGRPFLWVIRDKQNGEEERLSCREELERQGMIVPWCSQLEVLNHPSLGCFLTHCGWNSSMESLVSGVPVVAFPQWTDQGTNAKLIEDVWKTGVRVKLNEEGIVGGDEIKRCLDLIMGNEERSTEMRENAKKWKNLAREATKEGGSSDENLKLFVNEVVR